MRKKRSLNLKKAAKAAVIINTLQVLAVIALSAYIFHESGGLNRLEVFGLCVIALVIVWGAFVDISDAFAAMRTGEESDMLEEALAQLEDLNVTLRKQRHDFMNHLQVVFGLIELEQKDEARAYVERIYGDIQRVGRSMKTALPAVNALLAAKMTDCEQRKVAAQFDISSDWEGMPVPAWEICRVLGNLIDNALDALDGVEQPQLKVSMRESVLSYLFTVEDNGAGMPKNVLERVFQAGFTTKRTGHGMGLAIVQDILQKYGGTIEVASEPGRTVFTGCIPKKPV